MEMNRNRYTGLDALVAAEIRELVERTPGVTIKGIAERLGIRRATLTERMQGRVPFSPSLLAAVAAELGTSSNNVTARAEAKLLGADAHGLAEAVSA